MNRYDTMFARLEERGEGAFVPFLMLGDPTPEASLELVEAAIAGGADALELGIGFSDPVADGPVITRAHGRARANGAVIQPALDVVATLRERHPEMPIGMLLYANMALRTPESARRDDATTPGGSQFTASRAEHLGGVPAEAPVVNLIKRLAEVGADSILVADCPLREADPLCQMCEDAGIAPVFIAPPGASREVLQRTVERSQAYVYMLSRAGVTGTHASPVTDELAERVRMVRECGPARLVQGFGIRTPDDVRAGMATGMDGIIAGSALVSIIEQHLGPDGQLDLEGACDALRAEVSALKAATTRVA